MPLHVQDNRFASAQGALRFAEGPAVSAAVVMDGRCDWSYVVPQYELPTIETGITNRGMKVPHTSPP